MSVTVMAWVWEHSRAKGSDRLLLLAIADCADDDGGNAYPGIAYLMRKTLLPRSSVYECVRRLLGCPEGCAEPRDGGGRCGKHVGELQVDHQGEGRGDPTVYRVLMRQTRTKSARVTNGTGHGAFPQYPQGGSSTGETVREPDSPVRDPSGQPDRYMDEPRTTLNHARARAKGNNPQDLSTSQAPAQYVHDPSRRSGHDPDACAVCADPAGKPAPAEARRSWREAVGAPNDWPNGKADPPPIDMEAERVRNRAAADELRRRFPDDDFEAGP